MRWRNISIDRIAVSCSILMSMGMHCTLANASSQSEPAITDKIYMSIFSQQRKTAVQQKRSRINTAAMGIRGLDTDDLANQKQTANADMRAVYEMEDRSPEAHLVLKIKSEIAKKTDAYPPSILKNIDIEQVSREELQAEIDLGRKMAAQILGSTKMHSNIEIQNYANALAQVIAEAGLTSPRPLRVAVLESNHINAFACPGGYIFITQGALQETKSEAQLAALLGHEIAHVSRRHLLSSLKSKIKKNDNSKLEKVGERSLHLEQRKRIKAAPSPEQSAWANLLGPKGVGLTVLQASNEALDTLLSKGLSHEFEFEADALGAQLSAASGYRAESFVEFLQGLRSRSGLSKDSSSATHPPYLLRIERLKQFVAALPALNNSDAGNSSLYLKIQKEWLK